LEPAARELLRLGVYQLRFLDRIPREIAVSATQDSARMLGLGRLTGLLNAVLRKVASTPEALPEGADDAAIGVRASLPDWIVAELRRAYGDAACEREALALRERARVVVRPNAVKGGREALRLALAAEGIATNDGVAGSLVLERGDPFQTAAWRDGLFVAQDPASIEAQLLVPAAGMRVLDVCAGRGIKATALAERGARVVAIDTSERKLEELRALAGRLGVAAGIERAEARDGCGDLSDLGLFDAVLVDAPCTGVGTLRRHPEIAWHRTADDVRALTALQAGLVASAARQVRVGGSLVYAVCSFLRAEGAIALPSDFDPVESLDVAPSSGLDAFQARRFVRRG
jgi:16S rRNA (cytosine967-C5)-methyltransferase